MQSNFNGRLFINPNDNIRQFELFKGGDNKHMNIKMISSQVEPNELAKQYFSYENIEYIHKEIINKIENVLGKKIGRQSDTNLQIIMKSIYLQYSKNNNNDIGKQINELNRMVIDESTRIIIPNIMQYEGYIKDITAPLKPLPLPINTNNAGNKTYQLINF